MKKYKYLTILATLCIVISIFCIAYISTVTNQSGYTRYYSNSGLASKTGISSFEAMLNYEQLAGNISLSSAEPFSMATFEATPHTCAVWAKIRSMYQSLHYLLFLALAGMIVSIWSLKKVRRYQCFLWGGIGAFVVNLVCPVLLLVFKSRLFVNVLQLLRGNPAAVFYDDPVMANLIPQQWAMRNIFLFERNLFLGAVISIVMYFLLVQRAKPHRF